MKSSKMDRSILCRYEYRLESKLDGLRGSFMFWCEEVDQVYQAPRTQSVHCVVRNFGKIIDDRCQCREITFRSSFETRPVEDV